MYADLGRPSEPAPLPPAEDRGRGASSVVTAAAASCGGVPVVASASVWESGEAVASVGMMGSASPLVRDALFA
jgi:hypothetical protein